METKCHDVIEPIIFNEAIIIKSLHALPNKISCGSDGIPSILLKKYLKCYLTTIIHIGISVCIRLNRNKDSFLFLSMDVAPAFKIKIFRAVLLA